MRFVCRDVTSRFMYGFDCVWFLVLFIVVFYFLVICNIVQFQFYPFSEKLKVCWSLREKTCIIVPFVGIWFENGLKPTKLLTAITTGTIDRPAQFMVTGLVVNVALSVLRCRKRAFSDLSVPEPATPSCSQPLATPGSASPSPGPVSPSSPSPGAGGGSAQVPPGGGNNAKQRTAVANGQPSSSASSPSGSQSSQQQQQRYMSREVPPRFRCQQDHKVLLKRGQPPLSSMLLGGGGDGPNTNMAAASGNAARSFTLQVVMEQKHNWNIQFSHTFYGATLEIFPGNLWYFFLIKLLSKFICRKKNLIKKIK